VPINAEDLELFAARIRPYFDPELRDIAQGLALGIARCVGAKVKLLRPETKLSEVLEWFRSTGALPDSLDQVELVVLLETELGWNLRDEEVSKPDDTTFRNLVLSRARNRRAA